MTRQEFLREVQEAGGLAGLKEAERWLDPVPQLGYERRRLAHGDEQEEPDRQVHDQRVEPAEKQSEIRPAGCAAERQLRQHREHHHSHRTEPLHTLPSVAENVLVTTS